MLSQFQFFWACRTDELTCQLFVWFAMHCLTSNSVMKQNFSFCIGLTTHIFCFIQIHEIYWSQHFHVMPVGQSVSNLSLVHSFHQDRFSRKAAWFTYSSLSQSATAEGNGQSVEERARISLELYVRLHGIDQRARQLDTVRICNVVRRTSMGFSRDARV